MKAKKVKKERIAFVLDCTSCGKEVEVREDIEDVTFLCYDCRTAAAMQVAKRQLSILVGAEIISLEPRNRGHLTTTDELIYILVKSKEGRKYALTAGGRDEIYIEWEEVEE